jgi:magnesium chelatase family protein
MEARLITIGRASGSLTFPANFTLIAAMSPCPHDYHGYQGDSVKIAPARRPWRRYQKFISGSLLVQIDIHVDVLHVSYENFRPAIGRALRRRVLAGKARCSSTRDCQPVPT